MTDQSRDPASRQQTEQGRSQVFVAFAEDDRAWVEGFLLDGLRQAGVSFLDESQFRVGHPLSEEYVAAVERSDRVLLVISPAFFSDENADRVRLLAEHSGHQGRRWVLIPLVLEKVDELPLDLDMLTALDATDPDQWESRLGRLVSDLGRSLPEGEHAPECPYPGMAPFTETMNRAFFGRTAEIDEAVTRLRHHPVLAVVGTSGSGKSSLLEAGVRPRLVREGYSVVTVRPGRDPVQRLRAALSSVSRQVGRPVALVVDQLEELFTIDRRTESDSASSDAFCAELIAQWSSGRIVCILAMRADYYPQLMTCPLWEHVRGHRLELLPLTGRELRQAIIAPARNVGVYVESALVERIVSDASGEPGSLPLVQETLVMLWHHVVRRYLPMRAYEALILTRSSYGELPRTALQVALARHADATIDALDGPRQLIARRILLRLVQLMDGREDVRRQQQSRELASNDDSPEVFAAVLGHLIDSRLVTSTGAEGTAGPGETLIDLGHEALITGWPRLREWIVDRRSAELFRRRLQANAEEWVRLGPYGGGLLDEVELAEAERWLAGPDASELGTSTEILQLVGQSRSALDAARRRKARLDRLFRVLTSCLAILLVAVVVVALVAVQQRNDAVAQRALSRSSELGLAAAGLEPEQLDRALLLGQEGLALRRTPVTVAGALAGLASNPRVVRVIPTPSPQYAVAVSPDGTTAVSGGLDGAIRLWHLTDAGPSEVLAQLRGEVRSVALSPDAHIAAGTSMGGDVRQFQLTNGGQAGSPAPIEPGGGHVGSVRAVAYSPDGRMVATAGQDGTVLVRDVATGAVRHELRGYGDWLNAVVFTPDGALIAAAGGRTEGQSKVRRIVLYDASTGAVRGILPGHSDAVRSLAVSADGSTLASAGAEGSVKLWSLPGGRLLRQLTGHTGRIFAVAFSPDGQLLASAGRDRTIRLWKVSTGRAIGAPLRGHTGAVRDVAFTGRRQLLSVGNDYRMVLWDVGDRQPNRLASFLPDQQATTRAVGVDPGGQLVATGDDQGHVVVRRTSDGSATGARMEAGGPVVSAALGSGGMLVTATSAGRVQVWDAVTGQARTGALDIGEGSLVLAVSRDGRLIATGGNSTVIRLWDTTLHQVGRLVGHQNWVRGLAFRPQDGALFSAGADGMIYRWTTLPRGSRTAVNQQTSLVESMALSPDGHTLATGNREGQVVLWDADASNARGVDQPVLSGQEGTVTSIAFDPAGTWIVTSDSGGWLRLWGANSTGDPWGVLGRVGTVSAVAAVSNVAVLSAGSGGPARWTLAERDWRRIACAVAGRNLTVVEARRYGFASPPQTCPEAPGG